jgi:diguanylate cyclase (GGDEF)-like protein
MRKTPRLFLEKFRQHSFAKQWTRGIGVLALMAMISGIALVFAWKAYQPRTESVLFLKQEHEFSLNVEQINTQTANLLYSQLKMMEDYRLHGEGALVENGFPMTQLQGARTALAKEVVDIKLLLTSKLWTYDRNKTLQTENQTKLQNANEEVSRCLDSFNQLNDRLIQRLRGRSQLTLSQQAELEIELQRKGQLLTQAVKTLALHTNQQAEKVLIQATDDEQWLLKGMIVCSALAFLWNGGLLYFLGRSLKGNAALVREMSEVASLDPLTGLLNRRALEQHIPQILPVGTHLHDQRSPPSGQTCLMLIDLDFFKKYNDTFGHVKGDEHLKNCADIWRKGLRGNDVLARMGGEEFAVVMPNCTEVQAYATAQRLQKAMPANTTFSAGVSLGLPNEPFEVWYERADQALYLAKEKGRSRTELAGIQSSA